MLSRPKSKSEQEQHEPTLTHDLAASRLVKSSLKSNIELVKITFRYYHHEFVISRHLSSTTSYVSLATFLWSDLNNGGKVSQSCTTEDCSSSECDIVEIPETLGISLRQCLWIHLKQMLYRPWNSYVFGWIDKRGHIPGTMNSAPFEMALCGLYRKVPFKVWIRIIVWCHSSEKWKESCPLF